jgi:hypothetical protein
MKVWLLNKLSWDYLEPKDKVFTIVWLAVSTVASLITVAFAIYEQGWPEWWNLPLLFLAIPFGVFMSALFSLGAVWILCIIIWNGIRATFGSDSTS